MLGVESTTMASLSSSNVERCSRISGSLNPEEEEPRAPEFGSHLLHVDAHHHFDRCRPSSNSRWSQVSVYSSLRRNSQSNIARRAGACLLNQSNRHFARMQEPHAARRRCAPSNRNIISRTNQKSTLPFRKIRTRGQPSVYAIFPQSTQTNQASAPLSSARHLQTETSSKAHARFPRTAQTPDAASS
jgi:hypothetical protein